MEGIFFLRYVVDGKDDRCLARDKGRHRRFDPEPPGEVRFCMIAPRFMALVEQPRPCLSSVVSVHSAHYSGGATYGQRCSPFLADQKLSEVSMEPFRRASLFFDLVD